MHPKFDASPGRADVLKYRMFQHELPRQDEMTGGARRPPIRLGVDLGACFSKLTVGLLDGDGTPRVAVVRGDGDTDPLGDPRISARVTLDGGRLWFAGEAERRRGGASARSWASLKPRVVAPEQFFGRPEPLPDGLDGPALLALSLLFLLQAGARAVEGLGGAAGLRGVTVTVGDPLASPGGIVAGAAGLALAALRAGAPDLRLGLPLGEAAALLGGLAPEPVESLPELEAALAFFHRSPYVQPGRHALVDVGAAFTRAACIHIERGATRHDRGPLSCFGVVHGGAAADRIDAALAEAGGLADPALVRGDEGMSIVRHRAAVWPVVSEVQRQVFDVYRAAHALARVAQPGQWDDYGLLLFGGGSWIRVLREFLLSRTSHDVVMGPSLLNAGRPDDLVELDGRPFRGDPDFLMTAYGLALGASL